MGVAQSSVAVAKPVVVGSKEVLHVATFGGMTKSGGVVSLTDTINWLLCALFPQASIAIQVRWMVVVHPLT